ncbi:MAG: hypothetical protein PHC64_07575 [Candidatus Gastranaerophilales bacterium]|nr:hypothetical protein [Candidatus Gastranaerophilales bacterium]
MKKKYVVGILVLLLLSFGFAPAFSLILDKPPVFKGGKITVKKMKKNEKTTIAAVKTSEAVNPLYPAKYTQEYISQIKDEYKCSCKDEVFFVALDMLKGTSGEFSRNAVLGNNLTTKPIKIEFKDLGQINKNYASYDALGWKRGKRLYIYISNKHNNSPAIALAALLSHEALHQDEYNSLAEETYAWTMEAAVWCELVQLYPNYNPGIDSLVQRENTLKTIFERGNYTDKYIKKTVYSNTGYQNLPQSSPGFEAL